MELLKYFPELTPVQTRQYASLQLLYEKWNEKINVISRKDITSLYVRHVLHSLSIAAFLRFSSGSRILDLGTGGGFPGIPLAIFFPDVQFHLVDSVGKKIKVVNEVIAATTLQNVTAKQMRVEEIHNSTFDFVVSRAVAPLIELWKWSKPLLKSNAGAAILHQKVAPEKKFCPADVYETQIKLVGHRPALICLKGGNLLPEIKESGTTPLVVGISQFFEEEFFRDKYILVNNSKIPRTGVN